jgi:hypothetical protein
MTLYLLFLGFIIGVVLMYFIRYKKNNVIQDPIQFPNTLYQDNCGTCYRYEKIYI